MGRVKVNLELIEKDKARRIAYRKRKEVLLRKMHEFTTLCDVDACAIIQPLPGDYEEQDEVWPKNKDDEHIRRLIDLYENKKGKKNKSYGLVDYFADRNKKLQGELQKLRKKKAAGDDLGSNNTKYPDFMDGLSEMQLRELGKSLDDRMELVKNRLDSIKKSGQQQLMIIQQQQKKNSLIQQHNGGLELNLANQPRLNSLEASPQEHHHNQAINNPNSMITFLLNENISIDDALQIHIDCSSTGTSSHNRVGENVVYNVPRSPLTSYNYYPAQTMPPQSYAQMQYPPLLFPGVSPPDRENVDAGDIHHYTQMMGISPWYLHLLTIDDDGLCFSNL